MPVRAVLWSYRGDGLIATYSDHSWKHRGHDYHRVSVAGGCCLLFGITRDPSFVTEPIELFSFTGPTFRANGVAVAQYIEQQEMWHGLIRPHWWRAMRVTNAATASALVDESHVVRLNPWDPVPGPRACLPSRTSPSSRSRSRRKAIPAQAPVTGANIAASSPRVDAPARAGSQFGSRYV
jgi:hypothetical protein